MSDDAPRKRGRPRIDPNRLQAEIGPSDRGYVSIKLRADAVEMLDTWRESHNLPSRHAAMADLVARAGAAPPPPLQYRAAVVSPPPEPVPVPWERIREELLSQFGYAERKRIDAALMAAGWPGE